jgi:hypothetical protein
MSRTDTGLPSFNRVAAALRTTTEHLARELAQPSDSPPSWSDFEWAIARSVAGMQGISTLLANNLRWRGPPAWQAFLAQQREQSVLREARVDELLRQLDTAARRAGIACVALKGSALRTLGFYRPGERPMGDVDLLVGADDLPSMAAVMQSSGYQETYAIARHTTYSRPQETVQQGIGEHAGNPLKVEIHTTIAEALPVRMVDITAHLRSAEAQPGLNAYARPAALMLHFLLHAAGNMRAHALRQIQLHDIAELSRTFGVPDWQALFATARGSETLWWAYPALALAARYYPHSVPPERVRELRSICPMQLRFAIDRATLTDVSWSNLRIHAIPGIAWARTPLDVLRYARSRALPSRAAIAELDTVMQTAGPQLSRVPWYRLPHRKRIARWLFSRPPRVQTMSSVIAALRDSAA